MRTLRNGERGAGLFDTGLALAEMEGRSEEPLLSVAPSLPHRPCQRYRLLAGSGLLLA